jgi:hypothetical protein
MLAKYGSPASVRKRSPWLKNYYYGDYKIGKTVTVAHCAERPLLFAIDNGWVSLKDWPDLGHVEVIECQGLKHYETFVTALSKDLPLYQEFDHVILDPWSKLVDMRIDYLQDNAVPNTADARVQWGRKPGTNDPDFTPFTTAGMGDYLAVRDYFRKTIYPLMRIQKHVSVISHLREPSFLDKTKTLRSSVPGKTHEMIAREVDFIGLMEAEGENRTISFLPNSKQDAGSRFRELHGKTIKAEDLPKLYKRFGHPGSKEQ